MIKNPNLFSINTPMNQPPSWSQFYNMKIKVQVMLAYLLIAFLLLPSSQSHYSSIPMQITVNHDMKTRLPKPNRFLLAAWEHGTNVKGNMKKVPSAPNPKGNRHVPSKP
ncbi:hypothetical protein E1A91_A10G239000v1 [Gossypium mustelinum]|uniref:CLAVATA3/ESR (CLE)-related protein 46-like n=6 Tax=Gossypium TaxID=3633 RepID=A0A1U8ILU0_GOSHI|nr:uncharacterized protein LOC107896183 [Gossypium hirsutum]KAB2063708.1 hypothetical protein ES319_A10G235400v1 [Gossypium barbadense]TYH00294.1 hypothetical protein ES288_A10G263500v1 [Gossypium darwinii]TYI07929.1 hypothetical protein ES332_A10G260400v1 [Gossypium tomentosum]TYJ16255.1 hypothetical protein E1A91_A10G239000v1 [Gossypium mustelinum]